MNEILVGIYLGVGFICAAVMVNEEKDKHRPDSVLLTIGFFYAVFWPIGLLAIGLKMVME